ncbi:MAG: HNH endonuclease [Candidatus Kapabacteria bacterium]|nr:HNH endonuclease [Candidatus Kapabacteria bacterium]
MHNTRRGGSPNTKVLVLNQSYEPISLCSVKKAFLLVYLTKAEIVAAKEDRTLRSVSVHYPCPSVIRLCTYVRVTFRRVELSRKNIVRRDNGRCQYCNKTTPPLTIDHIIPKSRGGEDSWENLITACMRCNNYKGNRTPEEAGMRLLSTPKKPSHVTFLKQVVGKVDESWRPYLFMD